MSLLSMYCTSIYSTLKILKTLKMLAVKLFFNVALCSIIFFHKIYKRKIKTIYEFLDKLAYGCFLTLQ